MSWLADYFRRVFIRSGGAALPDRDALNFIGFTVTDNPATKAIDVEADTAALPTVSTGDATPVYVTLATLAVGDVKAIDVLVTIKNADASVRQSFKLSGLFYGAAGPTATLDGGSLTDAAPRGTGTANARFSISIATVRLKITGIAATNLVTTYDVSIVG